MKTTKTFTFLTNDYEFSHGHTPRGRGSWAFSEKRNPDFSRDSQDKVFWSPGGMLYSDAKKWLAQCVRTELAKTAKSPSDLNVHVYMYVLS